MERVHCASRSLLALGLTRATACGGEAPAEAEPEATQGAEMVEEDAPAEEPAPEAEEAGPTPE